MLKSEIIRLDKTVRAVKNYLIDNKCNSTVAKQLVEYASMLPCTSQSIFHYYFTDRDKLVQYPGLIQLVNKMMAIYASLFFKYDKYK